MLAKGWKELGKGSPNICGHVILSQLVGAVSNPIKLHM
jgi:hypothetical protein